MLHWPKDARQLQMFDDDQITSLQFNRPCPVCDGVMELSAINSEPWSLRTMGERLQFRCPNCGVTQSEWSAISVEAPSTAADWAAESSGPDGKQCKPLGLEPKRKDRRPAAMARLPKQAAKHLEKGRELLKEAKGLK
jgi:endogenous inhibitor of DNA gyrase (YacG/DUF329 family)